MKRRRDDEDSSSVEVERITLNIDKYLNELEKSLDRTNKNKLPNYMHEFAKSSVDRIKNFTFSDQKPTTTDLQPSTSSSGDENNLSSANSQTAMIRRLSNLDLYKSQEKLNKNDLRNFSSSSQNLANFNQFNNQNLHHSNFSHHSNFTDRTQPMIVSPSDYIINANEDDDEQLDSVQFTTPFEFKNNSNKKFSKHSSKSRYLSSSCLPSIELRWRNLTYVAKNVSSTKERHTTNVKYVGGKRLILDRQNGELHGGELAGIIGPSGAGAIKNIR